MKINYIYFFFFKKFVSRVFSRQTDFLISWIGTNPVLWLRYSVSVPLPLLKASLPCRYLNTEDVPSFGA